MPDGDDDDAVFSCYEDMSVWSGRIDAARFWIEGVALTTVGFVGFLGKVRSIRANKLARKCHFTLTQCASATSQMRARMRA